MPWGWPGVYVAGQLLLGVLLRSPWHHREHGVEVGQSDDGARAHGGLRNDEVICRGQGLQEHLRLEPGRAALQGLQRAHEHGGAHPTVPGLIDQHREIPERDDRRVAEQPLVRVVGLHTLGASAGEDLLGVGPAGEVRLLVEHPAGSHRREAVCRGVREALRLRQRLS